MSLAQNLGINVIGHAAITRGAPEPMLKRTRLATTANWSPIFDELADPDVNEEGEPVCDYFDAAGTPREVQKLANEAQRCAKATAKGFSTRTLPGSLVMDGRNIVKQTVRFYRVR